jgi:arylsulfatase
VIQRFRLAFIRSGRWKLVSRYPDGWELYDMTADRVERQHLAPRHPDVVGKLSAAWEAWAKRANVDWWTGPRRTNWGDDAPAK